MMTDTITRRVTRKPSPKALRAALRKRQKAWRDRRKVREAAAMAELAKIADDDRIVITGAEAD
jgi:hypothetical protein